MLARKGSILLLVLLFAGCSTGGSAANTARSLLVPRLQNDYSPAAVEQDTPSETTSAKQ